MTHKFDEDLYNAVTHDMLKYITGVLKECKGDSSTENVVIATAIHTVLTVAKVMGLDHSTLSYMVDSVMKESIDIPGINPTITAPKQGGGALN